MLAAVALDRGCFACALGDADRRTCYTVAADFSGPAAIMSGQTHTGRIVSVQAPAACVPRPAPRAAYAPHRQRYERLAWLTPRRILRFRTTNRKNWKILLFMRQRSRLVNSISLSTYSGITRQNGRARSFQMNVVWSIRFIQAPASPISMCVTKRSRPSSLG